MALTRVRHPDDLLLEDTFPSMSVPMKQKDHPAFQLRQAWERKQEVLFAKTIRTHMRDPDVYPASLVWTEAQSQLAERILETVRVSGVTDIDDLLTAWGLHPHLPPLQDIRCVWDRLHTYPHSTEFQLASREDSTAEAFAQTHLDTAGSPQQLSDGGWCVKASSVQTWLQDGLLDVDCWEFFARRARPLLPAHMRLRAPWILRPDACPPDRKTLLLDQGSCEGQPALLGLPVFLSRRLSTLLLIMPADDLMLCLVPKRTLADAAPDHACQAWLADIGVSDSEVVTVAGELAFAAFAHLVTYSRTQRPADCAVLQSVLSLAQAFASTLLTAGPQGQTSQLTTLLVADAALRQAFEALRTGLSSLVSDGRKRSCPADATTPAPKNRKDIGDFKTPTTPETSPPARPWLCPANPLGLRHLGRVVSKPRWFNDPVTCLVNCHGCQIGLSCGLLALNHVIRSLAPALLRGLNTCLQQ